MRKGFVSAAVGVVVLCGILKLESCWGQEMTSAGEAETPLSFLETREEDQVCKIAAPSRARDLAQEKARAQILPSGNVVTLGRGEQRHAMWTRGLWQTLDHSGRELDSFSGSLWYNYFYSTGEVRTTVEYAQNIREKTRREGHTDFITVGVLGTTQMPKSTYCGYGLIGAVGANHDSGATHYTSYTLDPHLSCGYDWVVSRWCILEPCLAANFVFNFQNSFTEQVAGLSVHHKATDSGLLRLEPRFCVYGHWTYDWGMLILREGVSYVRKQSVYGIAIRSAFAETDLTVDDGIAVQNFFSFNSHIFARIQQMFCALSYIGQWGSGVTSNKVYGRLGFYF